jgi:hypothetical protein
VNFPGDELERLVGASENTSRTTFVLKITNIIKCLIAKHCFFFLNCISPFTTTGLSGTLRSACFFFLFFPYVVRRGSGVLSPATHAHPLFSFLLFWTTQHEYNKHNIHPGFEPCRPRGGVGRVSLFLPPPYRQPLIDIHTHPWPGEDFFLGKNPPPSVRFEPTSAGTATSEHCLRQPCGHPATHCFVS